MSSSAGLSVPNSSGTEPPRLEAPANAADCHIHIYDARFAPPVARPANATVADYRLLQKRIGVNRVVIVTPRNYATDNSVTVDAISQLGIASAREWLLPVPMSATRISNAWTQAAFGDCVSRSRIPRPPSFRST